MIDILIILLLIITVLVVVLIANVIVPESPKFKENDIVYKLNRESWESLELLKIINVGKSKYQVINIKTYYKNSWDFSYIEDYYKKYEGSLEGINWDKVK